MDTGSDSKNAADPQRRRDSDPVWKAFSDPEDLLENIARLQRVQGLVEIALSPSSGPAQAVNLGVRASDEVRGYLAQRLAACRPAKNESDLWGTFRRLVELAQGLERMGIKLTPETKMRLFLALHFFRSHGEAGHPDIGVIAIVALVFFRSDGEGKRLK